LNLLYYYNILLFCQLTLSRKKLKLTGNLNEIL
jgi:hypothetical protein